MAQDGPHAFKPLSFGAGAAGTSKWFWLACAEFTCGHLAAVPYAPFAIRWGLDAPLDWLRKRARCSQCGHKGAVITLPSWSGESQGWAAFPASQAMGGNACANQ